MNYSAALYQKLSCPYDPDVPLFPHGPTRTPSCSACGRAYHETSGVFDLRPDDLRSGTANWQPGPQEWNPGALELLVGKSQSDVSRPDGRETLDIGCGARATGTVNIDVYAPDPLPQDFVLAAADRLPFLPGTFDRVVSRYVIEHVTEPASFISSCLRLSRSEVDIITDNADWIGEVVFRVAGRGRIFHPEHVYKWSVEYLKNLCARFDVDSTVTLETLSETFAVKLCGMVGRGKILAPFLHRDLCARLRIRPVALHGEISAGAGSSSVR
jgi:SAM-dependent methyltransferase